MYAELPPQPPLSQEEKKMNSSKPTALPIHYYEDTDRRFARKFHAVNQLL